MTLLPPAQRAMERGMDELENFFASVRSSNPFMDNRVNGLSADNVNVDDIHRTAFESLTSHARKAFEMRRGLGAVLWGEAGIGKSHLLSRLARWADHDQQACAIYLHNLQASPENLPRSLLKSVVSILTRGQTRCFASTPLYDLVFALVKEALHHDYSVRHPWPVVGRAYINLVDRMAAEDFARAAPVERTVFYALFHFFRAAYLASKTRDERIAVLAVRWLSGDYLDPNEAKQLGLPLGPDPEMPNALADNQQIKQVLVALSRAALSRGQPYLLCFDQVDNLDNEQFAGLSRFLEALIDSAPNLFVVTAGIQASLLRWRQTKIIQDSAWDRMAQFEVSLLRLSPAAGRHIVAARLEKAVTPFVEMAPVRQLLQRDALFPLGSAWAEEFFRGKIDLRPRDVINGAREGWQREQHKLHKLGGAAWLKQWGQTNENGNGPEIKLTPEQIQEAVDAKVAQKIAELHDQRREQADNFPVDADNLAGLVAGLLKQLGSLQIERPPTGKPDRKFPYSLVARRRLNGKETNVRSGILFLITSSATSTTAALRWLTSSDPFLDQVVLVTAERFRLAFGTQPNAKGREYFEELRRREQGRFKHIELSVEQIAYLDALQEVFGMARGGDLEIELHGGKSRPVSEQDVIDSLHRRKQFLDSPLLRELLTESVTA